MKLKIREYPEKILKEKTIVVKDPNDPKIKDLVLAMVEKMKEANGVGLAAPQIGSNLRICTIGVDEKIYILINPKITAKSKQKIISEEGCLSFPGQYFPISRHTEVQVRYIDENGKAKKVKGRDLLARALQHEIDHLDGILIIDRMKKSRSNKKQTAEKA